MTTETRNIHQRINAVQAELKAIPGTRPVSSGGSGMAFSHDAVIALLRPHLVKAGIAMSVTCCLAELDAPVKGRKRDLFRGEFAVAFINIDNPDDRQVGSWVGHAPGNGIKAPGKAARSAIRDALLATFLLPCGDAEIVRHHEEA